jgi:hypothetical protein
LGHPTRRYSQKEEGVLPGNTSRAPVRNTSVEKTDALNALATGTPAPTVAPTDADALREETAIKHHAD